jgi:transketolase
LAEALKAAEELEKNGIETLVVNCHTIKPMDEGGIIRAARTCGAVVTVEEHQISGGLGSAVSEVLSRNFPVPIEFIGINDSFGESAKSYDELWKKFGLKKENIVEAVKKVITRKNS